MLQRDIHLSIDGRSRRTGLAYANGAGMTYEYDTASRLLSLDNSTNSGHHEYEYTYDKVGNRATMAVTNSGGTEMHVYTYDDIYQITAVDYPAGYDPALATDTTFNYDDAGNRTTVIDAGGTSTYATNALNQYTAAGGVNYTYDTNGNMTYDGANTYGYDPENRLTAVQKVPEPLAAAWMLHAPPRGSVSFPSDAGGPKRYTRSVRPFRPYLASALTADPTWTITPFRVVHMLYGDRDNDSLAWYSCGDDESREGSGTSGDAGF